MKTRRFIAHLGLFGALSLLVATAWLGAAWADHHVELNPCAAKTINPCAAKTINPCESGRSGRFWGCVRAPAT